MAMSFQVHIAARLAPSTNSKGNQTENKNNIERKAILCAFTVNRNTTAISSLYVRSGAAWNQSEKNVAKNGLAENALFEMWCRAGGGNCISPAHYSKFFIYHFSFFIFFFSLFVCVSTLWALIYFIFRFLYTIYDFQLVFFFLFAPILSDTRERLRLSGLVVSRMQHDRGE